MRNDDRRASASAAGHAGARTLSAKGRRRRAQILDVAERVLRRRGYENLTMRQVAKQCDIDLKNLQYYFPTKEDLFIGVVRELFETALDTMTRAASATRRSPQKVSSVEHVLFELWDVRVAAIWSQLYAMAPNSRKFMTLKEEIYTRFYEVMTDLLLREYPQASRAAALRTARVLTALIDGATIARTPSRRKALDFRSLEKDIQQISKAIIASELGGAAGGKQRGQRGKGP